MLVSASKKVGFWKNLWRVFTGVPTPAAAAEVVVPPIVMPAPAAFIPDAVAHARFGSGAIFGLSARLASTHSLNSPVQRREGKAAVVPREMKVVQGVKAKPKAVEAIVKKSRPNRHVWLSSRPQQHKSADIIKFVPRSQRQAAKRAA